MVIRGRCCGAANTNKHPKIVARYFLEHVNTVRQLPMIV